MRSKVSPDDHAILSYVETVVVAAFPFCNQGPDSVLASGNGLGEVNRLWNPYVNLIEGFPCFFGF